MQGITRRTVTRLRRRKLTGHRLSAGQLTPHAQATIPEHLLPLLTRVTFPFPEQRPTAAECAELLRAPAKPATPPAPVWHDTLVRLLPPAVLLTLFTIILFQPGYSYPDNVDGHRVNQHWSVMENFQDAFGSLALLSTGAFVGLVMAAVLVPGSRLLARLMGYAGAALAVGCLLWLNSSNPPYYDFDEEEPQPLSFGMWLF
ncbi:hypothetical protein [Streptomyces sp. NPDC058266]|uniref:hypothetical protein n=1 Tax=Streptomyces sp. NPDC058266 TaxID=3346412 RepID=UPI0036EB2189